MSDEEKSKIDKLAQSHDNLEFTRYLANIKNFNLKRFEELKSYGESKGLLYLNFPTTS